MTEKELSLEMKELKKIVKSIQDILVPFIPEVRSELKGLNEKFAKQNGRVNKLEDSLQQGIIEDVRFNEKFKAHTEQDDKAAHEVKEQFEKVAQVAKENKEAIISLKGSLRFYAGALAVINVIFVPIVVSLLIYYLTKS